VVFYFELMWGRTFSWQVDAKRNTGLDGVFGWMCLNRNWQSSSELLRHGRHVYHDEDMALRPQKWLEGYNVGQYRLAITREAIRWRDGELRRLTF
jgi:hypothetical protein